MDAGVSNGKRQAVSAWLTIPESPEKLVSVW